MYIGLKTSDRLSQYDCGHWGLISNSTGFMHVCETCVTCIYVCETCDTCTCVNVTLYVYRSNCCIHVCVCALCALYVSLLVSFLSGPPSPPPLHPPFPAICVHVCVYRYGHTNHTLTVQYVCVCCFFFCL